MGILNCLRIISSSSASGGLIVISCRETAGRYGYQFPKAMFEFAFEGALLAFIVNGDRYEM